MAADIKNSKQTVEHTIPTCSKVEAVSTLVKFWHVVVVKLNCFKIGSSANIHCHAAIKNLPLHTLA